MATTLNPLDALQIVRAALTAIPAVSSLVGDRVTVAYDQMADVEQATYPLLVLVPAGGDTAYSGRFQHLSLELRAYASISPAEALAVYNAACDGMQAENLKLTVEGVERTAICREVSRPAMGWDGSVRKHVAVGRWNIFGIW